MLESRGILIFIHPYQTRISTKYTLIPPSAKVKSKSSKSTKAEPPAASTTSSTTAATPDVALTTATPPTTRATLTLKTYDPVSGVTLKYTTDKQAEVGRLISSLARLGRSMAGLPELKEDVAMVDVQALEGEVASGVATPVPGGGAASVGATGTQGGQGGQGGKKGKKKGRK
jgi:Signal recognition particle 9 kDa protein (SRP9)